MQIKCIFFVFEIFSDEKAQKNLNISIEVAWLREQDSNLWPLGYEPNELPTAPPRNVSLSTFVVSFSIALQS